MLSFAEPAKSPVFVTFILDDEAIGEVAAYPDEMSPSQSLLNFDSLLETISPVVDPDNTRKLELYVKSNKISVEDLNKSGWTADFDLTKLEIKLEIPANLRTSKGISVGYRSRKNIRAQVLRPANVSGYFNYLLNKDLIANAPAPTPLTGTLQSVLNLKSFIFEDIHNYTEFSDFPWRRSETRALYDDTNHLIRYSLGDVKYPSTGFQSVTSLGGISVTRDFSIDPLANSSTSSRTSFTLSQPSSVTIYVNNQMYRTLQLKPGRYEVTDLPISPGFNDVELLIMDNFGKTERLKFPYVFSSELLRVGLQKFSHNFGYASQQQNEDVSYDKENSVYSGFHRIGITPTWTGGVNLQRNKNQSVLGLESFVGSMWGVFNIDVASSEGLSYDRDYAERIRFRSWSSPTEAIREWGLGIESYGEQFVVFGSPQPSNLTSTALDAFISPQLSSSYIFTIGLSQRWGRGNSEDSRTASLRIYKTISQDIHITSEASVTEMESSGREGRLFVSLNWSEFNTGLNQSLSYDTIESATHYDLQKASSKNIFNVALDDTKQNDIAAARFFHNGQRINLSADYTRTHSKNSEPAVNESSNLYLSGALAWTSEGDFGIMSPIHDSFAIFTLGNGLQDKALEVNRSGERSEFSSEGWGNLAMPNLTAYLDRPVYLDLDSNSLISELDQQEFTLKPSYKSGISKRVHLYSTFVARGKLLKNQTPWSLKSGEIQSIDRKIEAVTFFTNKEGEFELDRLLPGRYRMMFNDDSLKSVEFQIPENIQGFFDLGILIVETESGTQ